MARIRHEKRKRKRKKKRKENMKATVSRLAVKSSKSTTPYPELDVPCEI